MNRIDGKPKTLQELLQGKKYTIHYYQREYRWGRKQIEQLIDDLTSTFSDYYVDSHETSAVENYGYYYLGSIIRTDDKEKAIIDGQQRLTSLTLMLIYLNNLQKQENYHKVQVDQMIFSDSFGKMSFNLDVAERRRCFESLYNNKDFDLNGESESVRTMYSRYKDIEELFPDELKKEALPLFLYWLKERVMLIEIVTPTEQDAHKIFVTMNDRGLNLNNAEMLKGYLLSEIADDNERDEANKLWKQTVMKLKASSEYASEGIINTEDVEFITTWIRAKYANTMREGKKGAKDKDYEIIGNEFHQWVRQNSNEMGLIKSVHYIDFVKEEFRRFADIYIKLKEYSSKLNPNFEYVYYNANRNLNYQVMLILSAITNEDNQEVIDKKIKLVSYFVDFFATIRTFNYKKVNFNTVKYMIFRIIKEIRDKDVASIAVILSHEIKNMDINLDGIKEFRLNQFTVRYLLHTLARFTSFINQEMGNPSEFETYINRDQKNSYDIEHVLPNDFDEYNESFENEEEFQLHRSKLGNLIILPRDKNRSYQDMPYSKKVTKYLGDNILAKSFNAQAYSNNPSFLRLKYDFKPYEDFGKEDINERQVLYSKIAEDIWNVDKLKEIANAWNTDLDNKIISETEAQKKTVVKNKTKNIRQELLSKFWNELLIEINQHTDLTHGLSLDKERTDHWLSIGSGVSGIVFSMVITTRNTSLELGIDVGSKEQNKKIYDNLMTRKTNIESTYGAELEWHRLDKNKRCIVTHKVHHINYYNELHWKAIIDFFTQNLPKFVNVFRPYLPEAVKRS
jgi:uncharacterized protein with ParB-like and HNH nuclease domain